LTIPCFATWLAQSKNQLRSNALVVNAMTSDGNCEGLDPGDFDALIFPRAFRALWKAPQTRGRQASN
jgi:hypothetical protein